MVDFAFNAPDLARFTVKFANWTDHGIVINGPKCLQDAKNFRRASKLILADARDDETKAIGGWLATLADQFQNAAGGMDPQAVAVPYDIPPETGPQEATVKAKTKRKAAKAKGKASARGNRKRRTR